MVELLPALGFGLVTWLVVWFGVGIAYPQSWPSSLAFAQLAASDRTPVHLMRFLEDARSRSVLRTVGPVYQFRHARLQDRLAGQEPATGQGPGKPRPAAGHATAPTAEPPVLDVAGAVARPVPDVVGAAAADVPEPEPVAGVAGTVASPGYGEQRAAPLPRDDHPRVSTSGPGPDEKTPRAPGSRRALWRRPVIISAAVGIAVIVVGLVIVITTISGTPSTSARWIYTTGGAVSNSPTVADGTVYVRSDRKVYALDAATGRPRWTYTTGGAVTSGPAVAGGTVYVGSFDRKVYALNAATGRPRWTYSTGGAVTSGPAVAGGTVYVGSFDRKVYALDAATGRPRWTYSTGGAVTSGPAVAGGTVYVGSEDRKVYALDAATGRPRWTYITGGAVTSGPAVAGDTVYVGSWDQKVHALDAGS